MRDKAVKLERTRFNVKSNVFLYTPAFRKGKSIEADKLLLQVFWLAR